MDGRAQWLQHVVLKNLSATPRAYEHMMKTQDGAKRVIEAFMANEDALTPTLCFYSSVMDIGTARLVHGGRLSGDSDETEPSPPPLPPSGGPTPESTAEGAVGKDPPAEGAAPDSEAASPAAVGETADVPASDAPAAVDGEAAASAPAEEAVARAPPPEPPPKPEASKKWQDPAELVMVHMCTPAEITPQACVSTLVYFNLKTEEPGAIGKATAASITAFASSTEGMSNAAAEAAGGMEASLDYGVIAGGSMIMLEQVMAEVYTPLVQVATQAMLKVQAMKTQDIEATTDTMEFVANMQKFGSQLNHAIQQMTGDVRLTMPQLTVDEDGIEAAAADVNVVNTLEGSLEDWTPNIAMALETQLAKQPVGKGPLAEIEHWRARAAALSTLYEQLNTPNARRMIRVLEKAESSLLSGFNYQFSELEKRYIEAKDNVKFLTTLERHFKHIRDGPLVQILDTLPSMMNALRMVWVISRHYKDDQRMEPLFGRIGWEIANRVSTMISMRAIFKEPAIRLITDAKYVLEKWKTSYMTMRQKIEESGRDNRWEFDRNKLFARTDYMAQRCGDLLYVAEMLRDMRAMLGPELKAVTGDAKGIDEVMSRVEALVVPLEQACASAVTLVCSAAHPHHILPSSPFPYRPPLPCHILTSSPLHYRWNRRHSTSLIGGTRPHGRARWANSARTLPQSTRRCKSSWTIRSPNCATRRAPSIYSKSSVRCRNRRRHRRS